MRVYGCYRRAEGAGFTTEASLYRLLLRRREVLLPTIPTLRPRGEPDLDEVFAKSARRQTRLYQAKEE